MIVAFILTSYALVFLWLAHDRQVLAAQLRTMRARMDRVDEFLPLFDVRRCRVCRCTDDVACMSGCWWVEDDLCSSCADDEAAASSLEGGRR